MACFSCEGSDRTSRLKIEGLKELVAKRVSETPIKDKVIEREEREMNGLIDGL